MAGLRRRTAAEIELIPGPGCPVCICPEEDVYEAIQLALHEDLILVAFGDMLRVPVNAPKRETALAGTGESRRRRHTADRQPQRGAAIAGENPERDVVFFAAGFETTTAPVAAMLAEGVPDNSVVLLSGRLTWPAVAMLLDSGTPGFDCLIAPGHVSTVMGPEEWEFVVASTASRPRSRASRRTACSPRSTRSCASSSSDAGSRSTAIPQVVRPGGNPTRRACSIRSWTSSMRTGAGSARSPHRASR